MGQAAADLGFSHLAAYDHVLGADAAVHGDIGGPYDIHDPFHEPLILFAYLAGFTDLAFATSILIGPQRQTALLAKQAAEVDIVSGGSFRLGLGHRLEQGRVRGPGMPFAKRGRILEEQIAVSARLLDRGERDVRRPLPPHRRRRVWPPGRCSSPSRSGSAPSRPPPCGGWDGWPTAGSPWPGPGVALEEALEHVHDGARRGRPRPLGLRVSKAGSTTAAATSSAWPTHARRWGEAGASHLSVNTMARRPGRRRRTTSRLAPSPRCCRRPPLSDGRGGAGIGKACPGSCTRPLAG